MYFCSEWLIFGLYVICDWLQVAYSFSFWLCYGKRNYSFSLLPYSPLFSAASPRDQLRSRHRVTVSSCDRLAYFWKSVPTLSLLEEKKKKKKASYLEKLIHLEKEEKASRGTRFSALGLQFCRLFVQRGSRDRRGLHFAWRRSPALKLCKSPFCSAWKKAAD